MEEKSIQLNEWKIHYIKYGHGSKYLFCICGRLGDGLTFVPLVEEFDTNKFTVIAWDPPGYGKSRPLQTDRILPDNFYEEDAKYAYEFMKALEIPKYSVLGVCDGGRVAMILAAQYPEQVESLIIVSSSSFILPNEIEILEKYNDVELWPLKLMEWLKDTYDYTKEDIRKLGISRFNGLFNVYKKRNGDVCTKILKQIQCKTFIFCGARDVIIDASHGAHLNRDIKNSQVHTYPEGGHTIHLQYVKDFSERVQEFISS